MSALLLLLTATPTADADQAAITLSGRRLSGAIHDFSAQPSFRADDAEIPLDRLRRIEFERAPVTPFATRPLRRFRLLTGDLLTGELVHLDRHGMRLLLRGGNRVQLPASHLVQLVNPDGLLDVLYEDFERPLKDWRLTAAGVRPRVGHGRALELSPQAQAAYRLEAPLASGRIVSWFKPPDAGSGVYLWLELSLRAQDKVTDVRIPLRSGPRSDPRDGSSWRHLRVRFDGSGVKAAIDGFPVMSHGATGDLAGLRFGLASPVETQTVAGGIDNLQIRTLVPPIAVGHAPLQQDAVLQATGGRVFGRITEIDNQQVTIDGSFGRATLPWSELAGTWHDTSAAPPCRTVSGLIARIEFQSLAGLAASAPDSLTAAITAIEPGRLLMQHPCLGRLAIPLTEVRRIEPIVRGTWRPLDPRVHHLGNAIRPDFKVPLPEATHLEGEFTLARLPRGRFIFVVEAAELEPAGRNAPPATPYLAELRAGHLRTGLLINGSRVGDLNSRIDYRSASAAPNVIRLEIPSRLLASGVNTWQLKQQPSRDDPHSYDDCEIGRIGLYDEQQRSPWIWGPQLRRIVHLALGIEK